MAATVVTASTASANSTPRLSAGMTPYWGTYEAATTSLDEAGDDILLMLFPATAYVLGTPAGLIVKLDDLDSNTTPTIKWDAGLADSDGVIDTVLINDSTVGQSAGVDYTDTGLAPWLDAGGKYLGFTIVTAAATAATGTIEFGGIYSVGVKQLS